MPRTHYKRTPEIDAEIVKLYTVEGLSSRMIARRLKLNNTTIQRCLNTYGVMRNPDAARKVQSKRTQKRNAEIALRLANL